MEDGKVRKMDREVIVDESKKAITVKTSGVEEHSFNSYRRTYNERNQELSQLVGRRDAVMDRLRELGPTPPVDNNILLLKEELKLAKKLLEIESLQSEAKQLEKQIAAYEADQKQFSPVFQKIQTLEKIEQRQKEHKTIDKYSEMGGKQ